MALAGDGGARGAALPTILPFIAVVVVVVAVVVVVVVLPPPPPPPPVPSSPSPVAPPPPVVVVVVVPLFRLRVLLFSLLSLSFFPLAPSSLPPSGPAAPCNRAIAVAEDIG